jgi:hypothetical protein
MRTTRMLLVTLLAAAAACSRTPPPQRVVAVVDRAPPPPRAEVVGRAPHAGWVYVPGYWNYSARKYVWVPGFWSVPPRGYRSWQAARWHHDKSRGWMLVRGRWK